MTTAEYVFARFLIVLIAVEWFADGQQWNFHAAKAAYQRTAKPQPGYSRAQLDRGPNFAAEQTIWVTLYVWAAYTTGSWFNWTIAGPISYLGVFAGSIPLTEYISAGKYPDYKLYQQRVGRCIPSIFGKYWKEDGELSIKDKVDAEAAKRANKRD
jgi:steroid 5-alpha reductase family enzyme